MSELYPTDDELNALSGASDPEQEVLYVRTGQSPYHTSFYRMLYRLLDVCRRAGDLRVYKDGELTFGIRAGRWVFGDQEVNYPGSEGHELANNQTSSISLLADGTLAVSTDGFPDPSAQPHLPLATITTAAGSYQHADITDLRGRALWTVRGPTTVTAVCGLSLPHFRRPGTLDALPTLADGSALGLSACTHGTGAPVLESGYYNGDVREESARLLLPLPGDYRPGGAITLDVQAVGASLAVGMTLGASAYRTNGEGGLAGGELCQTAAADLSTDWAGYPFVLDPDTLSPGDVLDLRVTLSGDDTSGSAGQAGRIGAVALRLETLR